MNEERKLIIAKVISGVFIPHLSLLYTLIAFSILFPPYNVVIAWLIILGFYFIIPLAYLLYHSKKLGKTVDEMSGKERIPIISVGFVSYILAYLIFLYLGEKSMAEITLFLLIFTTLFGILSFVTKPSFHTGAFVGGVVYISLISGIHFLLLLLALVPLIAWSRVILKAHTVYQTILGSILGFLIAFFSVFL